MELQNILPNLVKEVVKQTLESIMTAEREVFLKEHGGTKNGFYVKNLRGDKSSPIGNLGKSLISLLSAVK
jgi:hypothetical protein